MTLLTIARELEAEATNLTDIAAERLPYSALDSLRRIRRLADKATDAAIQAALTDGVAPTEVARLLGVSDGSARV